MVYEIELNGFHRLCVCTASNCKVSTKLTSLTFTLIFLFLHSCRVQTVIVSPIVESILSTKELSVTVEP